MYVNASCSRVRFKLKEKRGSEPIFIVLPTKVEHVKRSEPLKQNTIFNQITQLISRKDFYKIVTVFDGDKHTRKLTCWQQLMILLYSQIKDLKSLREIVTSLQSHSDKWKSIGIDTVARSTLSDANASRCSKIYEQIFHSFLRHCKRIAPKHGFNLSLPVFSHDSTLIPLCLSVFPWAKYRKRKGAMKLHTLLDHDGCLPSFIRMTNGRCHDVNVVKKAQHRFPELPPDSILTVDKGYIDYKWLYSLHLKGVVFIIPAKRNMAYQVIGQHKAPNKNRRIISDTIIEFSNYYQKGDYPQQLRLIRYWYIDKNGNTREKEVLTNDFKHAASTIAALYKGRWDIETFFKWIKQNLKIKTFIGTSENAVMTQVWVAMILYLLLSFIKYQTRFTAPLSDLLRIIKEVLLEKKNLIEYLRFNWEQFIQIRGAPIQLTLV